MSQSHDSFMQSVEDSDHNDNNSSSNSTFDSILEARMSKRDFMKGSLYVTAGSMMGTSLVGCGGVDADYDLEFSFNPVAKSVEDALAVPDGYSAKVLFATGDPIFDFVPDYANDGTDTDFDMRAGDHHDGMHYFGMSNSGDEWDSGGFKRGLICLNHEVAEDIGFMHVNGQTAAENKPTGEIDKEVGAHGVSVIEVYKDNGSYSLDLGSPFNRRVTAATEMDLTGPVAGSPMAATAFSPDGTQTRGTCNNCANGYTPWGTYLTCEENWPEYFARWDSDRDAKDEASFGRIGVRNNFPGRYNWSRPTADDPTDMYSRWNASVLGDSAADDYRNVPNTYGYVVEIDPFNPNANPRKRTTMGRFRHEGCYPAPAKAGQPLVFYTGDDARNEYIYKFVTTEVWDEADRNGGLAVGDKYLNSGTLYVAKFLENGTGIWIPLTLDNTDIAGHSGYSFADAADLAINTRHAGDAAGATKMDRPEWGGINPVNGEVYFTLTNSISGSSGRGRVTPLDAANPRSYTDDRDGSTRGPGNMHGHIIRWREAGGNHAATMFEWDIYLFGAEHDSDPTNVNLSFLVDDNDFSSPDGLWFSDANQGLCWIQTDDSTYRDTTNCMMLAALPGQVGDGRAVSIRNFAVPANGDADQNVTTYAGAEATTETLRRFLVGPSRCEITGIAESPDRKAIFVNVQHPGEGTSDVSDPTTYTSHWPDGGTARPRSATVVVTRDDGGEIAVNRVTNEETS